MLWHTAFPTAILVYALTNDDPTKTVRTGRPVMGAIALTIACALAMIAGLTWIVTTKTQYLLSFYTTDVRFHSASRSWLTSSTRIGTLAATTAGIHGTPKRLSFTMSLRQLAVAGHQVLHRDHVGDGGVGRPRAAARRR